MNIVLSQVKILAIDDGIPPKTATATLTVVVQDINDNPPRFLKDYRPVLPEYAQTKKVVEILATDDDDRSRSNGPPFTFRMDPNANDVIRASFKVESDNSEFCQEKDSACENREIFSIFGREALFRENNLKLFFNAFSHEMFLFSLLSKCMRLDTLIIDIISNNKNVHKV